jgi:hypothetical protein
MNVFEGIFKNWMFLGVFFGIIAGQVVIIELTSIAFKVADGGLPWEHWLIAVLLGLSTWVTAIIFKKIPDTWCP